MFIVIVFYTLVMWREYFIYFFGETLLIIIIIIIINNNFALYWLYSWVFFIIFERKNYDKTLFIELWFPYYV